MKAEYVDHLGSDLTVVNSARVSFAKESQFEEKPLEYLGSEVKKVLPEADQKLIKYLAKHAHWTPFSHPQITLRETVPIFVARQRFKHMVGFTYNEVSRRYVDDEPEFFTPDVWRSRPEGGLKQGSGNTEILQTKFGTVKGEYEIFCHNAKSFYEELIESGVAPEQARMVLPQSMYTSYYVTGSLAAFARAYTQRIDAHAQVEIQDLAKQWGEIIAPLYPVSWKALTGE